MQGQRLFDSLRRACKAAGLKDTLARSLLFDHSHLNGVTPVLAVMQVGSAQEARASC